MELEHSFEGLKFEPGTSSLSDIKRNFPLPVVVVCDASKSPVPVDRTRFNFDLRQPLLLYRSRNIKKISARSVYIDPSSRAFHDVGEQLLIPEDYRGYFSLLKKNYNNGPVDDFVPHYQEVSEVAGTNTESFLIGGERRVQALQIVRRENGSIIHQQRTLFPGDVLRKGKIYIGEKRRKSKIFRKTKVVAEKYLLCTDDADREILLPFDQKGLFYTLTTTTGDANRPVMQMSEIVDKKCFPCIVRLVYGRIPNTPCSFTGTLRLERADLEQSVVAATLANTRNILLEIPTSCDLQFNVAISNDDLIRMPSYHQALELCNEKGSIYMRNIKVCYTISSDSHNEPPLDLPLLEDPAVEPEPVARRRKLSKQLSTGTDTSDDYSHGSANRSSDYVEMRSVKSGSITEESCDEDLNRFSLFSKEINHNDVSPTPCACTNQFSNPSYIEGANEPQPEQPVLQIFLGNKCLSVEMKADDSSNESLEEPPERIQKSNQEQAPKPCLGSGGSYDSGIQMEPDRQGGRRPSTKVFSEAAHQYEDNVTYDVPRLPSRRDSAPPGCSTLASSEKSSENAKEAFNRRPSTWMNSTSPRRPPPPLPPTKEVIIDQSSLIVAIEEYVSEEETLDPVYQNIAGSHTSMENLFRHREGSPRLTPASSRCSSTRDSGHLSDDCIPGRSSHNFDRGRLSPSIFQTSPIGDIPDLPRSRRNSDSPIADDSPNSSLPIPSLPISEESSKKCKCDSHDLLSNNSKTVLEEKMLNDSKEENNNLKKSLDADLDKKRDTQIHIENLAEILTLTETNDPDAFSKTSSHDNFTSKNTNIEQYSDTSESNTKERHCSVSSSQSLDISDDNCEDSEESTSTPLINEQNIHRLRGPKISINKKKSRQSKDISKMTVQELAVEFRHVGIKQQTIDLIISEDLDGLTLLEKYRAHDSVRDFLPSVGLIDLQKISLFIQGCKY
ncbi:uncharacterized protein LOC133177019 [Saccostrea echinata]|uniref:uncharacterized protein LOC133177019 n=1 Tax=Saccostrea echinata TaxID=191078 RepID=UPI002A818F54|nr:uncharacterized protein LOC133177019 [Saccostrea echinata]